MIELWYRLLHWLKYRDRFADRHEPGKVVYERYIAQLDDRRTLERERRLRQVARAVAEKRKQRLAEEAENAAHEYEE